MKLQEVGGVHNINFVTGEHVVPQVVLSVLEAREMGLRVPVVYNTSGYDSLASIELLEGIVDVYLPDFKVWSRESGRRFLKAENYAEAAKESILAMYKPGGEFEFHGRWDREEGRAGKAFGHAGDGGGRGGDYAVVGGECVARYVCEYHGAISA